MQINVKIPAYAAAAAVFVLLVCAYAMQINHFCCRSNPGRATTQRRDAGILL